MSSLYKPANKKVVVTSAGTAVPLFDATKAVASIILMTVSDNSGNVYVGDANVDSDNGTPLKPEKSLDMELPMDANGKMMEIDASQIYIDADTNGNEVRVLWLERA